VQLQIAKVLYLFTNLSGLIIYKNPKRQSYYITLTIKQISVWLNPSLNVLQLEGCAQPAIVTKDLAMLVYGRDGRLGPRIKHLFQVYCTVMYRRAQSLRTSE
jgi:hypothetical protein